jgi:7-cyano-7-deazaguanine synthase in queuosine biosynthesis
MIDVNPLLAFAASADPDTMYYHEAMAQPDRRQFVEAMQQAVSMQTKNGNWSIVKCTDVPNKASILPAVWAIKQKRRKSTWEIYKWEARG